MADRVKSRNRGSLIFTGIRLPGIVLVLCGLSCISSGFSFSSEGPKQELAAAFALLPALAVAGEPGPPLVKTCSKNQANIYSVFPSIGAWEPRQASDGKSVPNAVNQGGVDAGPRAPASGSPGYVASEEEKLSGPVKNPQGISGACPPDPELSTLLFQLQDMSGRLAGDTSRDPCPAVLADPNHPADDLWAACAAVEALEARQDERAGHCTTLEAQTRTIARLREALAHEQGDHAITQGERDSCWKGEEARLKAPTPSCPRLGWTGGGGLCVTSDGQATVGAQVTWGLRW